jgi:F420-non-reducing hydrogenase iron-sulfur subunit
MNRKGKDLDKRINRPLKFFIFYCSNSFNIDEFNSKFIEQDGDEHKFISLPCSGKANLIYFLKAFETGADGLVLITCSKDECHYLEGNLRAPKRAEQVNSILEEIGLGSERIAVLNMNGNGLEHIVPRVMEFRDKIRTMAPNPAGTKDNKTLVNAS